MTTMPVLLQNHQTFTAMQSQSCAQRTLGQVITSPAVEQQSPLPKDVSNLTRLKSQYWTSTSLEWLGIYQTRSVQYIRHDKSRRHRSKYTMEDAISETREVLIKWNFLRLGLRWDRRYPYGTFGLSPTIYPVVWNFSEYENLISDGSVQDIQQRISSGVLHPYVRDRHGRTLLHVSKSIQTITQHI
jgi:hypothetical protein